MFKKNITKNENSYLIVRSMYGVADHIATIDNPIPFCGYSHGIITNITRSKIEIIDSIPNQHNNWFWCDKCAEKVTGFDAETIMSYRH